MPQLDPAWFASQIFWLFVCFTLLYVLLSKIILPPLKQTMEKRAGASSGDIAAAEAAQAEAERAKQDYERTLAQSREMAQSLVGEVLEENAKHADETMRALDVEISRKLADAKVKIDGKKHELFSKLTPAAAEFSGMIAEKITQKPVSSEKASNILMNTIRDKGQI